MLVSQLTRYALSTPHTPTTTTIMDRTQVGLCSCSDYTSANLSRSHIRRLTLVHAQAGRLGEEASNVSVSQLVFPIRSKLPLVFTFSCRFSSIPDMESP